MRASPGVALWVVCAVTACGGGNLSHPLRPEPVPYADTLPASEPRYRQSLESSHLLDAAIIDQFVNLFTFRRWMGPSQEAVNVTHFDDVVNSAWFEHRNGYYRLSPEDVARGPATRAPDVSGVLTIVDVETRGPNPGFIVRDVRGERYVFKFDPLGFLHLASAAEVISSRLLFAAGYNTAEDYIVVFDGAQLVLDPGARIPGPQGGAQWMQPMDLARFLSSLDRLSDGRFLAMARRMLPGVPKGPFHFEGRRSDDPNDYYYHEHRRELRGLAVLAAWINHVGIRFTDTQDVWTDGKFLRHYLIDFSETLGSRVVRPQEPRAGREHNFDLGPTLGRLFSLGFYRLPLDLDVRRFIHPSIGWLPTEAYDPGGWKPKWPNAAFSRTTLRDAYWGSKLVAAFTDQQIRAAVAAGGLSDSTAADTLAKILIFRRDRTVAHWYSRVTPIENVGVVRRAEPAMKLVINFDDLGIRDGVWDGAGTAYRWEFEHRAAGIAWSGESPATAESVRQAIVLESPDGSGEKRDRRGHSSDEESIATLTITALRGGAGGRPARIFLAWDAEGKTYRVAGLEH
ncbi:MAG: hypothetical protein ACE5HT_06310 [Gemmatimonadales bacterium]